MPVLPAFVLAFACAQGGLDTCAFDLHKVEFFFPLTSATILIFILSACTVSTAIIAFTKVKSSVKATSKHSLKCIYAMTGHIQDILHRMMAMIDGNLQSYPC